MVIPKSGTFEYQARFTEESFGDSEITLFGKDRRGGIADCLVGPNPKLRFWNDRLVIVASEKEKSARRNVSVLIGDAVKFAARPGDRLYVTRTGSGGIGMSVLRGPQLVLAIGAVTAVPLGDEIKVNCRPEEAGRDYFATDTWLEFQIRNHPLILRERATAEVEDYALYVERRWEPGTPGTDECASICHALDSRIKIAAMRSAILLGKSGLKLVNWDCSEDFI